MPPGPISVSRAAAALALLLAFACFSLTQAAAPVERKIVDDLTPVLIRELQQANISMLLVLPGPEHHSTMKLDWAAVTDSVERLHFLYNFEAFQAIWHGYYRYHRWHQLHGGKSAAAAALRKPGVPESPDAPLTPSEFDDIVPLVNPTPPKIALLMRASGAEVRSSQATLAAAITRRLRNTHSRTLTYSTHKDKGDTLLVFDSEGEPLRANFLSTTIFRDAFTAIYDKKVWAGGGGSGHGSDLGWTVGIRTALPALIQKYNISSMLDSSCGSMHWMPLVLRQAQAANKDFRFAGTDVVCSLITRHQVTFANESNWNFQCVDYSNQLLPSGYDLVFSRDSLQHIPMHGAWQFLNNVKASGAKYLLVGSYLKATTPNTNIPVGEYYNINLLKSPFKLSQPLEIIDEQTQDGKHMLLFDVQKMVWEDPLDGLV